MIIDQNLHLMLLYLTAQGFGVFVPRQLRQLELLVRKEMTSSGSSEGEPPVAWLRNTASFALKRFVKRNRD